MFNKLLFDKWGERNFSLSWQSLADDLRLPQSQWWRNFRIILRIPGNRFCLHLATRERRLGGSIVFSTVGDDNLSGSLYLPFLFALHWSIDRAGWVRWLPGVSWVSGDYESGEREIALHYNFLEHHLRWKLWRNPDYFTSGDWRDGFFHPVEFILGEMKCEQIDYSRSEGVISLPDGDYPVTVRLFKTICRRPRWGMEETKLYADVTSEQGVPLPDEDDAIMSSTFEADGVRSALEQFKATILHYRANPKKDD